MRPGSARDVAVRFGFPFLVDESDGRHALDLSGDHLCFGTATGDVYLSEDRGELGAREREIAHSA